MSTVNRSLLVSLIMLALHPFMGAPRADRPNQTSGRRPKIAHVPKPTHRRSRNTVGEPRYRKPVPFLRAAPKFDGIRYRWSQGKMVPRNAYNQAKLLKAGGHIESDGSVLSFHGIPIHFNQSMSS